MWLHLVSSSKSHTALSQTEQSQQKYSFLIKMSRIEYPGYPATQHKAALHPVAHTYKCSCVRSHILANVRTYGYVVKETESVAIRSSVILYDKIDAHVRMSRS